MAPNQNPETPTDPWLSGETSPPPGPATPPQIPAGRSICAQCGSVGAPRKVAPGSFLVELALWICFILPGLIYSLWRVSSKRPTCRACGAIRTMVPLQSPRGRQLAAQFHGAPGPDTRD